MPLPPVTRRVFGGLLAPDHALNDTTLTRWRELATHFTNPGETQDNIDPRVLLDEIDLLRAELNAANTKRKPCNDSDGGRQLGRPCIWCKTPIRF